MRDTLKCDIVIISNEDFADEETIKKIKMETVQIREFCKAFNNADVSDEKYNTLYMQIGGYPWIVAECLNTGNLDNILKEQQSLVDTFKNLVINQLKDITLIYGLDNILRHIAIGFESCQMPDEYKEVLTILEYYGIIAIERINKRKYKIQFSDCGITSYILRKYNAVSNVY